MHASLKMLCYKSQVSAYSWEIDIESEQAESTQSTYNKYIIMLVLKIKNSYVIICSLDSIKLKIEHIK